MPVSLERLIAEVESAVVTEELVRECIVVGGDAELVADKKASIPFAQVEAAAFSFRNLARIDNLLGLRSLVKLQLDNNRISRIENLSHLTGLTWLDLSFNRIAVIEGLDSLTKLQDLSLFSNQISAVQGLDSLPNLNVLSLGNNNLTQLAAGVSALVRFSRLHLLNLAGNPLAKEPDYQSFVLSHLQHLTYLDYRRVQPADVAAALEAHQDEVLELHECQEAAAAEASAAAQRAAHAAAMAAANLAGVDSLLEDMAAGDAEWPKLLAVPGLLEPWNDVRDKWAAATDEFKLVMLEAHARRQAEQAAFQAALQGALDERDSEGKALLGAFEKDRKAALIGAMAQRPGDADELVLGAKVKLMALQEALLALEADAVEVVAELVTEYDRAVSEMAEASKLQLNTYFTQVRDLQNGFTAGLTSAVPSLLERYGSAADNPELEALPEEVQLMLGNKDALLNAIQSSHEAHSARLDGLEDALVGALVGAAAAAADSNAAWQEARHRERMSELLAYLERNSTELDRLAADAADAADG